jgi:hypothetical protein
MWLYEVEMGLESHKVSGIKVLDIVEENAEAIEKMVNKAIADIHRQKIKILDIQTTGDNLIIILGDQEG